MIKRVDGSNAKEDHDILACTVSEACKPDPKDLLRDHLARKIKDKWHALSTNPEVPNLTLFHGLIRVLEAKRKEVLETLQH